MISAAIAIARVGSGPPTCDVQNPDYFSVDSSGNLLTDSAGGLWLVCVEAWETNPVLIRVARFQNEGDNRFDALIPIWEAPQDGRGGSSRVRNTFDFAGPVSPPIAPLGPRPTFTVPLGATMVKFGPDGPDVVPDPLPDMGVTYYGAPAVHWQEQGTDCSVAVDTPHVRARCGDGPVETLGLYQMIALLGAMVFPQGVVVPYDYDTGKVVQRYAVIWREGRWDPLDVGPDVIEQNFHAVAFSTDSGAGWVVSQDGLDSVAYAVTLDEAADALSFREVLRWQSARSFKGNDARWPREVFATISGSNDFLVATASGNPLVISRVGESGKTVLIKDRLRRNFVVDAMVLHPDAGLCVTAHRFVDHFSSRKVALDGSVWVSCFDLP